MVHIETCIVVAYFTVLGLLALFGLHRLALVLLYLRSRRRERRAPRPAAELPSVTVQLPVYNERFVVERLIDAVARLDYPPDRLEVQVLDDSDDDTSDMVSAAVGRWQAQGIDIHHLRRPTRTGFKAGALAYGLARARGELVAIFDADFVPSPQFLRRIVPEFADATVGMVQARWGHLNADDSLLTRVQAMMLNGHFVVEHSARSASGRFFNFNGTAGVFRRSCIDDAGGWEHDTLTEDLDLSYRAQLLGWRFVYRPDVTAEAELPGSITAFKSQQFRWAKGSMQTARKLLGRVLGADLPLRVRAEACVHLLNNSAYLLLALLALLLPVAVWARSAQGLEVALAVDLPLFLAATGSVALFFVASEVVLGGRWWLRGLTLPFLFAVGVGICINNCRAVVEALLGRQSPFLRTPKLAERGRPGAARAAVPAAYRASSGWVLAIEVLFALYYGGALAHEVWVGHYVSVPWLALFFTGFVLVGGASVVEGVRRPRPERVRRMAS